MRAAAHRTEGVSRPGARPAAGGSGDAPAPPVPPWADAPGGGRRGRFGGLSAARALIGRQVDVTIVDQRNFHTFQPLLYEVATAGLDSGDVAYPIRAIFGKADNVTFRFATVTGVDWERRQVLLADEADPSPSTR